MAALELDATHAAGEASSELDEDALAPGERVGEYVVDRRLGAGAFGAVYRAQHPVLGRDVAIKILHRSVSSNHEIVGRFLAEARAVNQIRHRNIIDVFGFGQLPDGRHYYVMECLAGEPLDTILARKGAFAPAEALPILRAIAKALDAAHEQGIVHRDLKAENVFLAREGEESFPKLLDFGIAKLISSDHGGQSRTRSGIQVGTPYAMAPEQCRGVAVDGRADVYALGVLTHRMLTGAYLFDGETAMDVIMKHMAAKPPPMSGVRRGLPSALDKPVLKMLAKEPSERFTRPTEAIDALADAMARCGLGDALGARTSGVRAAAGSAEANTLRSAILAGAGAGPRGILPAVTAAALLAAGVAWWASRDRLAPTPAATPAAEHASPASAASEPSRAASAFDVRLAVTPLTARVFVDEREEGTGSVAFARPKGTSVRVRAVADGHRERTETVVVESALRLEWVLEPLVPAAREPSTKATAPAAAPKPKKRERAVHSDLVNPLD